MPRIRRPLLALIVLLVAAAIGYGVNALGSDHPRNPPSPSQSAPSSGATSLPQPARDTVTLAERGGPFPYPRNAAVVFHNNEHRLPAANAGYDLESIAAPTAARIHAADEPA